MQVVEKGILYGHPDQDWMMGAKVGDPHPAIVLDRWVEPDTPYGPIYFVKPTIETMGRLFGMWTDVQVAEAEAEIAGLKAQLEQERQKRTAAELDVENLKQVIANVYRREPDTGEALKKAGPVKPKVAK